MCKRPWELWVKIELLAWQRGRQAVIFQSGCGTEQEEGRCYQTSSSKRQLIWVCAAWQERRKNTHLCRNFHSGNRNKSQAKT